MIEMADPRPLSMQDIPAVSTFPCQRHGRLRLLEVGRQRAGAITKEEGITEVMGWAMEGESESVME